MWKNLVWIVVSPCDEFYNNYNHANNYNIFCAKQTFGYFQKTHQAVGWYAIIGLGLQMQINSYHYLLCEYQIKYIPTMSMNTL